MFAERFAMNYEALRQKKPLVECAMYDLEASLTTIIPGQTPCLACLYPKVPPVWRREFPVFGAVSGTVGCMAAMEAIKVLAGFGSPLTGIMVTTNLREMTFSRRKLQRRSDCAVCGNP